MNKDKTKEKKTKKPKTYLRRHKMVKLSRKEKL